MILISGNASGGRMETGVKDRGEDGCVALLQFNGDEERAACVWIRVVAVLASVVLFFCFCFFWEFVVSGFKGIGMVAGDSESWRIKIWIST